MTWTNGPGTTNTYDSLKVTASSGSVDNGAEAGTGGTDLVVWSASMGVQYDTFSQLRIGDWTNNSSYAIFDEVGFLHPTWGKYDTIQSTTPSPGVESGAESGTGGVALALWEKTMVEKYDFVSSKRIQSWSDESSYAIFDEAGFLHPTWGKYDVLQTRRVSGTVTGEALDPDGFPLSGFVEKESSEGVVVDAKSVTGKFTAGFGPPPGVASGASTSADGVGVIRFTPTIADAPDLEGAVVPLERDDTGVVALGEFQYGQLTGTVTDVDGNALGGEYIQSGGQVAETGEDGAYGFIAPSGVQLELSGLGGGYTKTVTFAIGTGSTIDWQYAGISVTVSTTTGTPITGVNVFLEQTNSAARTDDLGNVVFRAVPPERAGSISVYDEFVRDVASGGEGFIASRSIEIGQAVTGTVLDAEGRSIEGLDVTLNDGQRSFGGRTRGSGGFSLGTPSSGSHTLRVAGDDKRYQLIQADLDVSDGVDKDAGVYRLELAMAEWRT